MAEPKAPKDSEELKTEQEEVRAGERTFNKDILIRGDDGPVMIDRPAEPEKVR